MNLMEEYEVVEVLEPEILTDLPEENFDSFTVYDLSFNHSLPSDHPDYFIYKNNETQEVLLVKYPQPNNDSGRISINSKRDFNDIGILNEENAKRQKNQIQSISTVLQESFSTNHHVETDEPLDSTDKEVRRITNSSSPPPTHAPIFRNVNGNLVREETFAWANNSPIPSYTSYPNARFSATNAPQNWIPSPNPYSNYVYNGYSYGVQQQQVMSPKLNQPTYPAGNYFNNYQYTPIQPSSPAPNEIQRIEQPKRVSFVSSELRQSSNEIYKQIEKHLKQSIPKYEYGVEPIQPSRIRTSENLNMDKLNELKRVLNYYPHLIREAKVVENPQNLKKQTEDEIQIGYQDKPEFYHDFDRKVTVHKLSDLIMRSKSSSEENLSTPINKSTQYECEQTNRCYSCCSCSHEHTHEPLQTNEINREALEIFKKVDEIVKSSKIAELISQQTHLNESTNIPLKENGNSNDNEVLYEETTKLVLEDIINKVEQNILIEEVENNSFNIVLEQTVSSDTSNLISNTVIAAPFSKENNKVEELTSEKTSEM